MKVLLACPGLESAKCGIGNYTKQFAASLATLGTEVVCYGGPLVGLYDRILETGPQVVHIQFEYGWASPDRLAILSRQCASLGIKFVVTLHSVSPSAPHNYALSKECCKLVVHAAEQRSLFLANAVHIPLAIPSILPAQDAITIPRTAGLRRIGWFGNVFFHKGLHKLLSGNSFARSDMECLILGGQPAHSIEYYDKCRELAKNRPNTYWYNEYLPDSYVVAHLATCDYIVFPYDEYGATGCSAALRLAFNAERPCVVSNTSHFHDVLREKKSPVIVMDVGALSWLTVKNYKRYVERANQLRATWSFYAVAHTHITEVYT